MQVSPLGILKSLNIWTLAMFFWTPTLLPFDLEFMNCRATRFRAPVWIHSLLLLFGRISSTPTVCFLNEQGLIVICSFYGCVFWIVEWSENSYKPCCRLLLAGTVRLGIQNAWNSRQMVCFLSSRVLFLLIGNQRTIWKQTRNKCRLFVFWSPMADCLIPAAGVFSFMSWIVSIWLRIKELFWNMKTLEMSVVLLSFEWNCSTLIAERLNAPVDGMFSLLILNIIIW